MSRVPAIVLAIGCLVLFAAAFQAKPVDVTGDWELAMEGGPGGGPPGGGDMPPMVVTFVQKGEELEAKMMNPMGEEMKGPIAMGDMGEMPWTAKRVVKK
jgi:hypothetical protein